MTRLAVVLVQILDPKTSTEKIVALAEDRLVRDDDAKALFEECYQIADRFMFTPDFLALRSVTWLGGVSISRDGDDEYARSDYFMVTNRFHRSISIHHHLAFGGTLDLTQCNTEEWRSCINALHELYWSWNWTQDRRIDPSNTGKLLDPFVRTVAPPSAALFASRGFYISVYDADPGLVPDWRTVAPALHSLLYLHSEGFDAARAADSLETRMAQTTEFFVSFFNADALLSLSCTYPATGAVDPLPDHYPTRLGSIPATRAAFEHRTRTCTQRFEPYDLLPEYPVLRYLDLGLTEFATNAKSNQWNIRRELDELSQERRTNGILRTITALPRIDRVYYRATALSILRLPAARDLAVKLIAEQALSSNEHAIDGMKASLLNTLVTILTAAALVIGTVQIVVAFL